MKSAAVLLFVGGAIFAQQTPPNVNPEALPQITIGTGPSWSRGDVHAASADINIAVRLGSTPVFSWSTVSTPIANVPAGSPPLASTVTTGLAYVVARSNSGRVSLL